MNKIIERPILMSGPMVRAILEDRKTMTRRALGIQPLDIIPGVKPGEWVALVQRDPARGRMFCCKRGKPGDHLWLRESWWAWGHFEETGRVTESGKPEKEFVWDGDRETMAYLDDYPNGPDYKPFRMTPDKRDRWHKRPSIYMPRWASRLTLEITGVRVERLQDISEEDAQWEGWDLSNLDLTATYDPVTMNSAREWFITLWQSINGKRPGYDWAANPYVWVISFKRVIP